MNFRKEVLYKSESTKNTLSHSKIILVLSESQNSNPNYYSHSNSTQNQTGRHGFIYIGSHNCTQAAWGMNSSTYLTIKNYECGIILPITRIEQRMNRTFVYCGEMEFKVHFHIEPEKYMIEDSPWTMSFGKR